MQTCIQRLATQVVCTYVCEREHVVSNIKSESLLHFAPLHSLSQCTYTRGIDAVLAEIHFFGQHVTFGKEHGQSDCQRKDNVE